MAEQITILTPTYNRGKYLTRIYESLVSQTCKNFEWVIVDDGSTDGTKVICENFINKPSRSVSIRYFYKENGGKHTAINYAMNYIHSDLVLILDSDDFLTNDAIQNILDKWEKYHDDKTICGFSFLRGRTDTEPLTSWYPKNEFKSNYVNFRINKNIKGDCCEVIKTSVLKEFPFKIFPDEKFLTESTIWIPMAKKYNTIYVNKIIYIGEYLQGGLTKSGKKLQMNNPNGAMYAAKLGLDCKAKLSYKIKQSILYGCYGFQTGRKSKSIIKSSEHILLVSLFLPIAYFFYKKWSKDIPV